MMHIYDIVHEHMLALSLVRLTLYSFNQLCLAVSVIVAH